MSWRVVVISNRCKLEYKLGYMVCRGEQLKKVFIPEISTLIIESTAVSLTAALLCELTKNKVNIVFCDEKHNPYSQLIPFYGRHDCSGMIKKQLKWTEEAKSSVWSYIVRLKIERQYALLKANNLEQAELLKGYIGGIEIGDVTNREGHAAKVYFNAIFGLGHRRCDDTFINHALNYGYAVILSAFNREIVAEGYDTRIGLAHKSEFNYYNLSCDFMEPFRILVDNFVLEGAEELTPDYKHSLVNILNQTVKIGGVCCTVTAAIGVYCKSLLNSLDTGDVSDIVCYEL